MGSVVAEKNPLDNEDSSFLISPPLYKRRKVSAIRDYPNGCGPNAPSINIQSKEVRANEQEEGGVLSNVECSRETGGDICEVVKISNEHAEVQIHNTLVCSSGANLVNSTLVKGEEVGHVDEEFSKPTINNLEPSKILLNTGEGSKIQNETLEVSNDMERSLESPNARMDIDILDLKEPVEGIANKAMDQGAGVEFCLSPRSLIPPNFVWKEPKFPPRRKVSTVRDFPDGCGRNVPRFGETEDKCIDQGHSDSKVGKVVALDDANQIEAECPTDSGNKDTEGGLVSGIVGDVLECYSGSDNALLNSSPPEIKGKEVFSKDKSGEQHEKLMKQFEHDGKHEEDIGKAVALDDANQIEAECPADNGKKEAEGGLVSGIVGDALGCYSGSDNALLNSNPYEIKGKEVFSKDKSGEQHEKDMKQFEHDGQHEEDIGKAVALDDANQIVAESPADNSSKDNEGGMVSGIDEVALECYSGSDNALLNSNAHEIKGIDKDEGEQHEKDMKHSEHKEKCEGDIGSFPDELDKGLVVYVKDRNKKKKAIDVPCSHVQLQEENIAGIGRSKEMVVVQGLMSALHCPWRQEKEIVKTTPTVARSRRKRGNRCGISSQGKRKGSIDKSKDDTKDMGDKCTMMIPYLEEDIDEASRPLDVRDDDDTSSENDDQNDYQFLRRDRICNVSLPPFGASSSCERGIRSKVRETLRLFQVVLRKLVQEEETKSKDHGTATNRFDISAAKVLKKHGKYINTEKVIGPVPGVEVGDIFNYRIELAIIGLHGPLQGGIATTKLGKQSVAISIVASGGYANDVDSSDVLIYTGQGGNATGGDKQPEDQRLERGNLALKNCIDKKTLVRVIRGFKETKPSETSDGRSKMVATYTYDGLYTVEKYWHDLGAHGKLVYKFELRRVPGQPELAWKEVKQSKKVKTREGRVVSDISEGKENVPICAINTIDDEKPPPFTYITSMMYPDWCQPIAPRGCDCKDDCSDSEQCACAVRNGGEIPFNYSGAIVQAKSLVYECGPMCKCPPSCPNRVSQNGIKLPLEIFKTESRGWGVRCLSAISSGSFICEYIGELLDDREADQRTSNDEYLFDIGQNYNDTALWEGLSTLLPDVHSSSTSDVIENIGFTIDAVRYGNVGRFINHSCTPNLYAQNVLYDYEDKRIPHIMLFAAENIPPLQELTYHYNYTIDQVFDSQGNIKKKSCYCGSPECTGRMY